MDGTLVLQTAQQVVEWTREHPEEIKQAGSWLRAAFSRSPPPVLMTGIKSVGKSVLWDFLTGAAYDEDYMPPDTSADVQEGKLKGKGSRGKRVSAIVIPGERESHARQEAFERYFSSPRKEISGLIYVVCAGFAKPRSSDAAAHLLRKYPELRSLVEEKRREELADLDKTCHELESYWRKHHKSLWMLVVTAKADLYQDQLGSIAEHYCLGGSGAFARRLEQLQSDVGRLNLAIGSAAVSCLPEDFIWRDTTVESRLDESARRAYVARLRTRIHDLCRA